MSRTRFDLCLLLLRLSFGLQMAFLHGLGKTQSLLNGATSFADPLGIGWRNSMIGTVLGEFVCGLMFAAGLGGRIAAVGMGFTMAVAAFVVHGGSAWAKKELAILYLAASAIVLIAGSGRWSLDHLLWPRLRSVFGRKAVAHRRAEA